MDTSQWVTAVDEHRAERFALRSSPRSLTDLIDPECALRQQCRSWMSTQAALVELRFVPCTGEEARARYGDIPWLGDELVVVGDELEVWVGPAPLAERFFLFISVRRKRLAALFAHDCADGVCPR